MKKILAVIGTRPEAIKMSMLIRKLSTNRNCQFRLCVTAQHRQMLDQVLNFFEIKADYDLDVMSPSQTLNDITSIILTRLQPILLDYQPDVILVHGDTSTTFAAALAGFHMKIPVGHVEAGLRTNNIYSPWPEEANRRLTSVLTSIHFAPTDTARDNLLEEKIKPDSIIVTGNTVVDALLWVEHKLKTSKELLESIKALFPMLSDNQKLILVTGHRRENFGEGVQQICEALRELAIQLPDVVILYPVHLNPNINGPVHKVLKDLPNIFLVPPLDYLPFVYLMSIAHVILTDSGGIQEEAPTFGKPVLLMRDNTERPEALDSGTVKLVGTKKDSIINEVLRLFQDLGVYEAMSGAKNPYGDGTSSDKIIQFLLK